MIFLQHALFIPLFFFTLGSAYANETSPKNQRDFIEILHRKFQIAYRKKLARKFPLALVEVKANCKAITVCANGVTLSCQVQGRHTSCYSDENGPICLLEDKSDGITGSKGKC